MKNFCLVLSALYFLNIKQAFGAEEGMPQLNPEFWPAQIFWLILIFSVLYIATWKIFLPKITESIENRKLRIVNDLNETEKLKENAEKKLLEYNQIIQEAKKDARKIIEENKKKLQTDIETKKQKFEKEIEAELSAVEKEIKNLKKNSLVSINKIASEITSEIVKQMIETEVNKSNAAAIVEEISKKNAGKYL
tara:strand:+ start:39 stop:617 length:579 start_codon:yes stop_codon:yes gene_type:complete